MNKILTQVGCKRNILLLVSILFGFNFALPDYVEKEVTAINYFYGQNYDGKRMVYFEDDINGIKIATYLKSDLAILSDVGTPKHPLFSFKKFNHIGTGGMLIVNDKIHKLAILHSQALIPYYTTYFIYNNKEYILINFTIFMWAGQKDYWNNIVLELDNNHNLTNITEIPSYEGRITGKYILNYSSIWYNK